MLLTVDFRGLDDDAKPHLDGSLSWDGTHWWVTPRTLANVLAMPVIVGDQVVKAEDDPETFLKLLHLQYRSAYFQASPIRDGTPEDATEMSLKLPTDLGVSHAPEGGVTVQGQRFNGGEFIPGNALDRAMPAEQAIIHPHAVGHAGTGSTHAIVRARDRLPVALAAKIRRQAPGNGGEITLASHEVATLLRKGVVGMVSAGPAPGENMTPEQAHARTLTLKADLVARGFRFVPAKGHYGQEEESFMVMIPEATRKELVTLGKQYGQESVLYSEAGHNELIYTTGTNAGKAFEGDGFAFADKANDLFTEVRGPNGRVKFTLKLDFEQMRDAKTLSLDMAAAHAPSGYTKKKPLVIGGARFTGGEFIPPKALQKATPAEKAKLGQGDMHSQKATVGHGATHRHVSDKAKAGDWARPGYHAIVRQKDGSYQLANGDKLPKALADRLRALRLPPAWQNVQVAADPSSPLQAIGHDVKGRAQYVYSADHTDRAKAEKFMRVKQLVAELPALEKSILKSVQSDNHDEREAAVALLLMRRTGFRIGGERDTKTTHRAKGATTLEAAHVKIDGATLRFSFIGKKGVRINQTIRDPLLAKLLGPRVQQGGRLFDTDEQRVRDYLHTIDGVFKPKDMRTVVAAETALAAMKGQKPPESEKALKKAKLEVAKRVARKLGNTPTIALKAYIPPEVFAGWEELAKADMVAPCDHCKAPNGIQQGQKSGLCRECGKSFPLEW